jgi:hypothetical protein
MQQLSEFVGDVGGCIAAETRVDQAGCLVKAATSKGKRGGAPVKDRTSWLCLQIARHQVGRVTFSLKGLLKELIGFFAVTRSPGGVGEVGELHCLPMVFQHVSH